MNWPEKYYREKLYPFQDGVLKIVRESNTPFYLTGGTAISRGYFNHRYSDDLDLFVNQSSDYTNWITLLMDQFERAQKSGYLSINYNQLQKGRDFTQFFLEKDFNDEIITLKIDLVNDTAAHYGNLSSHNTLGRIDSLENILSNKLSAIFRFEAKDIADIWIISKNMKFEWRYIVAAGKTKEAACDPVVIFDILQSFPLDELSEVKWINPVDPVSLKKDMDIIAKDIFQGNFNSLTCSM